MAFCLYSNIPAVGAYLSSPPLLKSSTGSTVSSGTNGATPYANQGLVVLPSNSDSSCPDLPAVQNVGVSISTSEYQQILLQSSQITTLNAQVSALVSQNNYLPNIATSGGLEVVASLFFAAFVGFKTGFIA